MPVVMLLFTCCLLLLPLWESVIVLCFVGAAGCFAKFVFLVSGDCCVALPPGAMGLFAVCEVGIS